MTPRQTPRRAAVKRRVSDKFKQKREEIVDVATRLINECGVSGMSLADVSAQLGLVPTGVFYYFPSKEELASACFHKAIARFESFFAVGEIGETLSERLSLCMRAHFSFARSVAEGQSPAIAGFNDVRPQRDPAVHAAFTAMFRRARRACFPRDLCDLDQTSCNARTHLLLMQLLWTPMWLPCAEPELYPRACARLQDVLENGLAAPGVRWAPAALPLTEEKPAADAPLSREDFLNAATRLINDQGYVGASVERISAALNVTKGAFYHHIETKDDLVAACFNRSVDLMQTAFRAAEATCDNSLDALASATCALVRRSLNGSSPLLHTFALSSVPVPIRSCILDRYHRLTDRIASLLSDGIVDGSIRPIDVNIAAQAVTAMINAAEELRFFAPDVTPDTGADIFVRPLFTGLYRQSYDRY
jgi:AcrR family transcriptional regulator